MVLARAATLPKGLGRSVIRRAGSNARNRSWRQVGRRGYASESGHGQQQSSEIPWMIGSAAVTIPAAGWLWQQGPKSGGDHGHDSHGEEAEGKDEESSEEQSKEEEPKDEGQDEEAAKKKDDDEGEDKDEGKDEDKSENKGEGEDQESSESKDEAKGDDGEEESKSDDSKSKKGGDKSERQMSEDGYEMPGPNAPQQVNWSSASGKGPGEGQKGERKPSERKGEKDSQGDFSGAKHPYLNDPEKSKKGAGPTETARIHGTVDPRAPAK